MKEQFVAVGEAGFDKLTAAPMELQVRMFEKQVELSEKYRLPLIIHCVKAMDELLAVRKKLNPAQPWIWHGFRGETAAGRATDKERHLSFFRCALFGGNGEGECLSVACFWRRMTVRSTLKKC